MLMAVNGCAQQGSMAVMTLDFHLFGSSRFALVVLLIYYLYGSHQ
jgi:hypothetical protein